MTNEKIYETICAMLREFDAETGNTAAEKVIEHPDQWEKTILPFYRSAAALLIDTRAKMDTKTTSRTTRAAVGRIIKNVPDHRESMRGLFPAGGKFCACDGYRIIRLGADITSLPHVTSDFDVDAILDKAINRLDAEKIQLPTVSELKAFIAANPKKKGLPSRPYCLAGVVWCNPAYLIDMIQALPDCTAYAPARPIDPIYFSASNGDDGILLPVRPPEGWSRPAPAENPQEEGCTLAAAEEVSRSAEIRRCSDVSAAEAPAYSSGTCSGSVSSTAAPAAEPAKKYHTERIYKGKKIFIDMAELSRGRYEVMALRSSGYDLAVVETSDHAAAVAAYEQMLQDFPEDGEPKPLTGKYAKLRDDIRAALASGQAAEDAEPEDGGTCNFDAPALKLPSEKWNGKMVEQAIREAGSGCFSWRPFRGKKYRVLRINSYAQGNARTRNAEAVAAALTAAGYDCLMYYQID